MFCSSPWTFSQLSIYVFTAALVTLELTYILTKTASKVNEMLILITDDGA